VLRVTSHKWDQDGSTTVGFEYQYDLAGSLTKAGHVHNEDHDEEFIYDGAYRLTQYYKDADDEQNKTSQDWTLDGVYNWTEFTDYGTTETRTHNSVNEVTAIDTNNDADFLYDKNGNLTKWTDDPQGTPVVKEFYWDDLNRLTKIKVGTSGGTNDEAIFIYDVNNQRVRKEYDSDDDGDIDGNDETIEYVWSDAHVIEEYVDGSIDRNYVHGNQFIDELILFDDGSDVYYYLQDFRYSVYAIVDDTGGTPKTTYRYDPYGKRTVVSNPGSLDDSYGFTGRYHDDSDDTDLIYFRNRWMSPEVGRFINRDPLDFINGMNVYTSWFIPLKVDPLGLGEPTSWAHEIFEVEKEIKSIGTSFGTIVGEDSVTGYVSGGYNEDSVLGEVGGVEVLGGFSLGTVVANRSTLESCLDTFEFFIDWPRGNMDHSKFYPYATSIKGIFANVRCYVCAGRCDDTALYAGGEAHMSPLMENIIQFKAGLKRRYPKADIKLEVGIIRSSGEPVEGQVELCEDSYAIRGGIVYKSEKYGKWGVEAMHSNVYENGMTRYKATWENERLKIYLGMEEIGEDEMGMTGTFGVEVKLGDVSSGFGR